MGRYLELAGITTGGCQVGNSPRRRNEINEINEKTPSPATRRLGVVPTGWHPETPVPGPTGDDSASWQAWYQAEIKDQQQRAEAAGRSLASALGLAYGTAQDRWHRRHGERPNPDCCAGCREPLAGASSVEVLADKARIHPNNECLIAYGARWRGAAVEGLRRLGIEAPTGWTP